MLDFLRQQDDESPQLGQRVRDEISGFEGIVTDIAHHISGCERYGVFPSDRDDISSRGSQEWFYGQQLEVVDETTKFVDIATHAVTDTKFSLGSMARDDITGVEGVITTITYDLFNTPQAALQPLDTEDKTESPEREWFDVPRLELIGGGIEREYQSIVTNPVEQETGPAGDDKNRPADKG